MVAGALPQSLIDNPVLGRWVAFEEGGRVRVASGKVEIGQGILTALTQIAAEELDVAPAAHPHRVGRDRRQSVRGVHVRQLFDIGRRSVAAPRLRRSARAVHRARSPRSAAVRRAISLWRTADSCSAGRIPATTIGRLPATSISIVRPPAARPPSGPPITAWSATACRASIFRQSCTARRSSTTSRHRTCCMPACCAVRGAARVSSRSTKRRSGAPPRRRSTIIREGDLVAFTADDETAVMRAAAAARERAVWDGGSEARARPGSARAADGAARARPRHVEHGLPGPRRRQPRGRGALFPAVPHLRLDRAVLCARRIQGRQAHGMVAHARASSCCATGSRARLGLERDRVTVLHRHGSGTYGHNTADDAAFDAAFIALRVPNRTVRVQWTREDEFAAAPISSAMAIGLRAVLDDAARPADWTIEIWSSVHAQRPGMNGNANLIGAEALPDAPTPERAERRAGRARRRRDPQRLCALRPAAPPAGPPPARDACRCAPRRCAGSAPSPTCSRSSCSWTSWPRPPARTR